MWITELKARDKKSAIRELLEHLVLQGKLKEDAARKAEKAIQKRESQGSTAIGKGLAIPHAKNCPFIKEVLGVFGRSREGMPFESVDGGLVHVIFLVISPEDKAVQHLDIMKRIARLHMDEKTLRFLAKDEKLSTLQEIFKEADDSFS
jgi:mannitol/fructose-specific phosphotransferase system IIA component (Ntr-type)